MTEVFKYPNSDLPEIVALPEEQSYADRPILSAKIGDLPLELERRVREAHRQGRLRDSLDHWTAAMSDAGIVDKGTLATLSQLRGEITGMYLQDEPVLDKIRNVFIALRTKKI
jgi:hypothetical protein